MNSNLYNEAMSAPLEYLDAIEGDILGEQDIHALIKQASQLERMKNTYTKVLGLLDSVSSEETSSLEEAVIAMIARVEGLIKDCDKYIALIEDEMIEEEKYGSYDQQVRATYYAGQL